MANSDNPKRGSDFENFVKEFFAQAGSPLQAKFPVKLGFRESKGIHRFDLGSDRPAMLVECKCHSWTAGGNSPAAKLSVWNEAMYFFALAPPRYRKIFAALRNIRGSITLAEHYLTRYGYMVPKGVEIWEFDPNAGTGTRIR